MRKVFVSNRGAKRIRAGHLWIYRSDVRRPEAAGGEIVAVFDEARNPVGRAFYSDASEIALRIVSTSDEEIDEGFWRRRIEESVARRRQIDTASTTALRLVSSEADLIPSLIVDNYAGVVVLQTLSQGSERLKDLFVRILAETLEPKAIIERNDAKVRLREKLPLVSGMLHGDAPDEVVISQNGIRFAMSPFGGQKTGSFLDQRENHLAARRFAHGSALDCFTFNGGFALNIAAGCERVRAIDISDEAIAAAGRNAELNGIGNVEFETANVFDALRELERARETFDTVILDPPAFVKTRAALESAVRGYKEINLRALKLLRRNGTLITCSCSYHFSEELFLETMAVCARDAKRRIHLVEKRTQSSDHPILIGVPESYYLKCLVFRAVD